MKFECDCGAMVEFGEKWNGLTYRAVFKADGVEIEHCPQCGEALWPLYYDRKIFRKSSLSPLERERKHH